MPRPDAEYDCSGLVQAATAPAGHHVTKRSRVASVIVGDTNLDLEEVADLAERCGGQLVRGHGPDHAIAIDVDVVDVRDLGKRGSDAHHALLYVFELAGARRRVLAWNVWAGQRPADVQKSLEQMIARHEPDVIVLNEAYRCGDVLRDVAGFRVYQGRDVGEGADVAVLVRRQYEVANDGVLQMQQRWTVVSHQKVHAGREYRFVRVRFDDGSVLRVLGIHFPTDHGINAPAVLESKTRVVLWATRPTTLKET